MLKKHLFFLALVSSSVIGVYAMEKNRSNGKKNRLTSIRKHKKSGPLTKKMELEIKENVNYFRAPDQNIYRIFQDGEKSGRVTLESIGHTKTTLKAKISCGKKAKNYVNIHDSTIISLKIISSKKDPSKRGKK